jgi:hypothetical protein
VINCSFGPKMVVLESDNKLMNRILPNRLFHSGDTLSPKEGWRRFVRQHTSNRVGFRTHRVGSDHPGRPFRLQD